MARPMAVLAKTRLLLLGLAVATPGSVTKADAVERMRPEALQATRAAVAALASEHRAVTLTSGFEDYRAVMHTHSLLSHDSRSPLQEVLAGAKAAGVRIILFNEHPAPHYDYVTDGHRGMFDGILVLPGAETGGYLAYPTRSLKDESTDSPQAFCDLVRRDDGLIFLCHLEERLDWQIQGITGNEIYNTHADLKNDAKLLTRLQNPLTLLTLAPLVEKFPQEMFGALLDYPQDYLARWDQLCQIARHTGVAGNDSHHNTGASAVLTELGKIKVLDGVGEPITELDPEKVTLLKALIKDRKPGDRVFAIDLDPYERSFRHVSTHLLLPAQTPEAVHEALQNSRAYVAFDWLGDPTGFVLQAETADQHWPVGSELSLTTGLKLRGAATLPGFWRLLRNGQEVTTAMGREWEHPVTEQGIYRVEVWLNIAGERRPWILSNPIYVR